jgi:hypothetical protein
MRLFAPILLLTVAGFGAASDAQVLRTFHRRFVRLISADEPVEKRPWVGVSVSPAPASLRHQLKVADGVGLVVEFVQPKSPAADAGIKSFDLLLKLDDQWLINPEQFAVLIRMHHAGDEVKLSYLREGNEHTVQVKLVEHEAARVPEWDGNLAWPVPPQPPRFHAIPARGAPPFSQSIFTWVDGQRQMSVTTNDGHRMLRVKENGTGKVLFDGPIDTDEQRAKLSPEIRHSLDMMERVTSQFDAGRFPEGERAALPSPSSQPTESRPPHDDGAADQQQPR